MHKIGCVWKTPFCKSSQNYIMLVCYYITNKHLANFSLLFVAQNKFINFCILCIRILHGKFEGNHLSITEICILKIVHFFFAYHNKLNVILKDLQVVAKLTDMWSLTQVFAIFHDKITLLLVLYCSEMNLHLDYVIQVYKHR